MFYNYLARSPKISHTQICYIRSINRKKLLLKNYESRLDYFKERDISKWDEKGSTDWDKQDIKRNCRIDIRGKDGIDNIDGKVCIDGKIGINGKVDTVGKNGQISSFIFRKLGATFAGESSNFPSRMNIRILKSSFIKYEKKQKTRKTHFLKILNKKLACQKYTENHYMGGRIKLKKHKISRSDGNCSRVINHSNGSSNVVTNDYSLEDDSTEIFVDNPKIEKRYSRISLKLRGGEKNECNVHSYYDEVDKVVSKFSQGTKGAKISKIKNTTKDGDRYKEGKDNKDENFEEGTETDDSTSGSCILPSSEAMNNPNKFLNVLYMLIEGKKEINENIANELKNIYAHIIKTHKDLKMTFLLLYTMSKLLCINNLIKPLYDDIYKVQETELLSIILRVLINSYYYDKELVWFILNKIKDDIRLGTCSTLTISNTFYCYAILYKRNLINIENIPMGEIIQIIYNYYNLFSYIQLFEIVDIFQNFSFFKDYKIAITKVDKMIYKNVAKLFFIIGNYFINKDIIKSMSFKNVKKLIYSYAKNKMYHEKLFLHAFPFLLKQIKQYNEDIMKNKSYYNYYGAYDQELNEAKNLDDELKKNYVNKGKEKVTTTNIGPNSYGKNYTLCEDNCKRINDAIEQNTTNVTDILYAYSKFNMYIDELYNEILLFLQHLYKNMNCSNLSQCLVSLTKVNCNITILLSKISAEKFNANSNYMNFFKYCTPIDLMNFLLSFSKNLFAEKEVYNILADLLLMKEKIFSLQAADLVNIIHAYSKIYYLNKKLFITVDNIISSRLDNNSDYLLPEQAIKYLNSCAKLSYKNEKIIYKIIEIIHKGNFVNIKIFDLFKLLKSVKKLDLCFESLETHIKMIAPNITFDCSKYTNYYYKAVKDLHTRKKKWVW
ncbi:heptatricopeptide repeat-containing protein [Plasmodium brasilianum]|uniref:Uncharacterized protein n=2 Tax=Plasmodium (Plasmodium) TaxID=418103 RepID=A0A1A8WNL0_PLAMA|nr:conserved Plasmodium protein, unknown function [Plasmodium malariae]KAI4839368.1 heptatricopeptide repeat-containing protein [Plasmodium brasilianum]SBS93440.1 conserved Plasmodium protein, unknown function [Plasmodium malariae]SBT87785.1 conserved Plasmodium protein, unknown function [Plasmodium malariae]